jgi:hypothetical protein
MSDVEIVPPAPTYITRVASGGPKHIPKDTPEVAVKYVILIHSNPNPWGHPTIEHTNEGRALSQSQRDEMDREFEALLEELSASGEFVTAEALGDPASATIHGWGSDGHLATDGPYAEAKEQLAGFFIVECETRDRAEAIATRFAAPGDVIELRPLMSPAGDDQ